VTPDKEGGTLTISDNGIGMSKDEVIDHLGTVAKSGTRAFLDAVRAKNESSTTPGLIGQFGVGFYSAFMVADAVTVLTRPAGGPALGTKWVSDGQGSFTVESCVKATRGTDVILQMKDDAKEFLDPWRVRQLVKKFSDFIEHPVVMAVEKEVDGKKEIADETLNARKAIWLRSKSDITPAEYEEFYKQIAHDPDPPAKVLHFSIEGKTEFKSLLFIPAHRPMTFDYEEPKAGLRLYAQRVLIMDRCEAVLPLYLRFVKGVVDSADLPLNVSREILQQNPHLDMIQKTVVRNVLSGLEELKKNEFETYQKFYGGLGAVLKEGITRDWTNREKVADLLLFESVNAEPGTVVSLAEYVDKMPAGQEEILYLTGEAVEPLRHSPYLESFRAKGQDVLLMTDPVDEFAFPGFEYKGKKFRAADRGEVTGADDDISADVKEKFAGLLNAMKESLPDVADVRLTKRLTDSAACLVADGAAMTAHMERLLRKFGEKVEKTKRVLEVNPDNPAVMALRDLFTNTPADPRVTSFSRLLFDQAVIAEGSKVSDPVEFGKRLNEIMASAIRKE
jgi:molecular chaperone HtpG